MRFVFALILSVFFASGALAKEVVKFGYLSDPSHEAVMWALKKGKVKSDSIEVQADALQIPALIQATIAQTYDVVQTAGMAIPRARSKGLDLRIIGTALRYHKAGEGADIWVRQDSPLQTAGDLKGKKLAVYSLGSSGITLIRIALANSHGFNVSLKGGDIEFVEMPPPGMPAALESGTIDAATLIHAQAFKAQNTNAFRSIVSTAPDNYNEFGVRMVSAVLAGYGKKLDAKPEVHREFLRLLHASVEYAKANPDEVFGSVAEATGTDVEFFKRWFSEYSDFPVLMSQEDMTAIQTLWDQAKTLGMLKESPDISGTVWSETLKE